MAFTVSLLLFALGVALATAGLRGRRVDDVPRCRRCDYDLRGHPKPTGLCPECGAMLVLPGAIARGTTVRRPRVVWIGSTLLTLGIAVAALDVVGVLNARTLDRLTPTTLLLWQASHGSVGSRGDAIGRAVERLRDEPLRVDGDAQRRLIRLLVDAHGEAAMTWRAGWNAPIDAAIADATLPADLRRRYFEQMIEQDVRLTIARDTLRPGDRIVLGYDHRLARVASPLGARQGVVGGWVARDVRFKMRLGDVPVGIDGQVVGGFAIASVFSPQMARQVPLGRADRLATTRPIAPGPRVLRVEMTFDIVDGADLDRGVAERVTRTFDVPVVILAE